MDRKEDDKVKILDEIEQIGIVPVVVMDDAKDAQALAKALIDGGLPCAEVTFRTAAAGAVIRNMLSAYPDLLVGAGTILNIEQAKKAIDAGAKFIVSPGINPEVVEYCQTQNVCVIPGCANPTNVEQAIGLGLDVVKFFPAEQAGGLAMLKAMSGPYPGIRYMPTGGISEKNLHDYTSYNKIVACGGSFMVKKEFIEKQDFDAVTRLSRKAVDLMLDVRLADLVNVDGKNQIIFEADHLDRVKYHWSKRGFVFDAKTAVYENDRMCAIEANTKEQDCNVKFVCRA